MYLLYTVGTCDYGGSRRYSVTFPPGVTRATFNINITDDDIFEGPETFILSIISSSLPSRVTRGSPNRATVIIMDNDECKMHLLYLHTCVFIYIRMYISM